MAVKQHDEILDVFHGTSKRTNHVISFSNPFVLNCFYPTQEFTPEKFNQPLAQFVFNRNKRSNFFTKEKARVMLIGIKGFINRVQDNPDITVTVEIDYLQRMRLSAKGIQFEPNVERYNTFSDNPVKFAEKICTALEAFIGEKGEEFPIECDKTYANGVTTQTMFLLTQHGDRGYGQSTSFLRYVDSTNGKGGFLTLQYGSTQIHIGEGNTRGISWKHFIEEISNGLDKLQNVYNNGGKDHLVRLYDNHLILGKYNFYVSLITEYRGSFITISSDLMPINNKINFIIEKDNLDALVRFLKAISIYLGNKK